MGSPDPAAHQAQGTQSTRRILCASTKESLHDPFICYCPCSCSPSQMLARRRPRPSCMCVREEWLWHKYKGSEQCPFSGLTSGQAVLQDYPNLSQSCASLSS